MQSIRQIERLNQTELDKCIPPSASWHTDYRDTAYLYIGGLPFELSEGDILTIFSQYGNPVHINLVRDKETGKSRGFCFLKYEDQRSCDLAVDNLSGAGVMGRVISVDHTRYKKKDGEIEGIGDEEQEDQAGDDTDREGDTRRKRRRKSDESEREEEEARPLIKEEIELQKLLRDHDDDDPMKEYLVKEKREEVAEALKKAMVLNDIITTIGRRDEKMTGQTMRTSAIGETSTALQGGKSVVARKAIDAGEMMMRIRILDKNRARRVVVKIEVETIVESPTDHVEMTLRPKQMSPGGVKGAVDREIEIGRLIAEDDAIARDMGGLSA
ncbi:Putative RNA recognition motif domain, nucleotide-binding alpha-beta plait domain superfamily [Septoria linicola]|uniref:RNA recognition motif domain, nucleotide-binding alpha-beta plait domain superfamily n=1 Tax=Septoria linicola TaxID=215465 RepID=A0A9Q9EEM3_9PEZI|nr:putative RNA recognition motif domain, nucleotide-binding alpha-beta plait domain superfamily [Septoria linicola]USW47069.1 Putative RNA recognition motif domain, nucleotide-binding alpha-beta plait domain superfamily [Septoria linicola]